tara:strand:+ start:1986 stop:2477 length:492 start_codon:yes stop_codon:yes gene_type:complete
MPFSRGKYAKAISDRSGQEFPYNEMVKEWNGMFVHVSEYEEKHPQLEPKPKGSDAQGLLNARPDRTETAVPHLLPLNPFTITNASSVVSVNEPDHGRSTGDTVRFRDSTNLSNITADTVNSASGYSITKTDDNNYTFDSGTTANTTLTGGGGSASAGPVTVTN